MAIVMLPYAWWAVSRPPFSAAATLAVLAAGVAAALCGAAGWGSPRHRPESGSVWRWWAVLAAVTALWQVASYLQHPREAHPTISSLTNVVLDSLWARAAAYVVWILATVRLARR